MTDLYLLGIIGPIKRFLMDTTVPFVLAVLGRLLPADIESVAELLP